MKQTALMDKQHITPIHLLSHSDKTCFIVKGLFSPEFCQRLKQQTIDNGFNSAIDKYPNSYRNNQRLVEDNNLLAQTLYNTCKAYIPNTLTIDHQRLRAHSVNERLRYCQYTEQQQFTIHRDGVFYRDDKQQSVLTLLLYLNHHDEFTGGETAFYDDQYGNTLLAHYTPEIGDVAIFDHRIWHSGNMVTSGCKYILRSDFIYTQTEKKTSQQTPPHHNGYIWKVITLDNQNLASASRDKSIKIWDKNLHCTQVLTQHQNSVFDLATDTDNNIYAVSRDGYMTCWKKHKEQQHYTLDSHINTNHPCALKVAVLHNNTLATSGSDGAIRLWQNQQQIALLSQHQGWVWALLPRNANSFISCDANGEVIIWDSHTYSPITQAQHIGHAFRCMAIHNNTLYLGDEQGRITALDIDTLAYKNQWQAHSAIVRDILVTAKGIISCGEDNKVYISHYNGDQTQTLFTHTDFATSVCALTNNEIVSSGYSGKLEKILVHDNTHH